MKAASDARAEMPGWKRDLGKRLDVLMVRNAPNERSAANAREFLKSAGG